MDPRWPGRKRARRSRRSTTSATRSGASAKRSPDVPRLRAVLFDIDGTLLDTRDAWVAAFDAGLAAIRKTSISGAEAAQGIGTPIEVIYAAAGAGVGARGTAGGVRRRRRHGERCRRGEGGGRSDDWCDLGLRHPGASRGRGRGLPDRDARCVGATPPGAHAQYGCLRYLYTDMTAVTASPHPVTIRLSFPGYETMSPHA